MKVVFEQYDFYSSWWIDQTHGECAVYTGDGGCDNSSLNAANPSQSQIHSCGQRVQEVLATTTPRYEASYQKYGGAGCKLDWTYSLDPGNLAYEGCWTGVMLASGAPAPQGCIQVEPGRYDCSAENLPGAVRQLGPERCPNAVDPGIRTEKPINFAIGNKYLVETFYRGSGVNPLAFAILYNSYDGAWRHSYERSLDLSSQSRAYAHRADGKIHTFYLSSGTWTPAYSDQDEGLTYDELNGEWLLTAADGETELYDESGNLVSITDRAGRSITLT